MKTYKAGEFAELLGVHIKTLQNWDRDGVLKAFRTPTGRRYYTEQQLNEYKLQHEGKVVFYCRIGIRERKDMLECQREFIRKYIKERGMEDFECVEEVGGGMDLERKLWGNLLLRAFNGEIKEIIVAHEDRFIILGFSLFKKLLESRGVKLTTLENKLFSTKEELATELKRVLGEV